LAKTLSYLNLKEVEVENLRRTIFLWNDELNILREQLIDKDKSIAKYHKIKAKFQEVEKLQGKMIGKPHMIRTEHILWDHIISKIT
jgi:hypothetical protein